jgi:hypothetical protein
MKRMQDVANIEPRVVQRLFDDMDKLVRKLEENRDMSIDKTNQAKVRNIRSTVTDNAGNFDANRWLQLNVETQREYLESIESIRSSLRDVDQPDNRRRPFNDTAKGDDGSKQSMIWLVIFGFIFIATLLSLIR